MVNRRIGIDQARPATGRSSRLVCPSVWESARDGESEVFFDVVDRLLCCENRRPQAQVANLISFKVRYGAPGLMEQAHALVSTRKVVATNSTM